MGHWGIHRTTGRCYETCVLEQLSYSTLKSHLGNLGIHCVGPALGVAYTVVHGQKADGRENDHFPHTNPHTKVQDSVIAVGG